jgi:hypothetical protein
MLYFFTSEKQKATIPITQGQKLTLLSTIYCQQTDASPFFFLRPQIFLQNCFCLFNLLLDLERCEASTVLLLLLLLIQLFWFVEQRQ